MSGSLRAKHEAFFTRRYCLIAAVVCTIMGIVVLATFVVALFGDPPPWNLVDRLMQGWFWLYVASLHFALARRP